MPATPSTTVHRPVIDTYISQYYATTNFGNTKLLYSNCYMSDADEYRSLIKFDLSQGPNHMPPNSIILSATLSLYVYRNLIPEHSTTDLLLHPIAQPWDALQVTWDNQPIFDEDTTIDIRALDDEDVDTWISFNVLTLVEGWYTGEVMNNGVIISCDEDFNSLLAFYGGKYENSIYRPKLTITYGVKEFTEET